MVELSLLAGSTASTSNDAKKNGQKSQLIEMDVTIGDMNTNPLFNTLLTDNEKDIHNDTQKEIKKKD